MKIYIHTDLEGISGIDCPEMILKDDDRYVYSIQRLMADVNAAIDGAFQGGATHVTVLDSHGGGNNFDLSLLDKRAEIDPKENGKWWGKLDNSYDATFFIGAHAMAGTMNGFLDHTQDSRRWFNYKVNGRKMGELAQWAMVAGHFDVPLIMVSGDEAACTEAYQFFNHVECAAVKRGVGRNSAVLVDNNEAEERIRDAARRSIELIGKAKPFKPILPMEIILELYRSDYCDEIACKPGVERLDARTVRKVANSALELFFR
jgi:D-amino peptidase